MKTSVIGRKIIEAFEGLERLLANGMVAPYRDEVGVLTQGYGHTNLGGVPPRVLPNVFWTRQQCDDALSNDLAAFEKRVMRATAGSNLTQSQFDALVSFDFNTGDLFKSSIPPKLRSGNLDAAMRTLLQYNHAGGHVLAGLTRRRRCEAALMAGDVQTAMQIANIKGSIIV